MQGPGKQKGMTAIGWLLVIAVVAIFALAALKLIPVYIDTYKISDSMNSLVTDPEAHNKSAVELRRMLLKRLDINMIYDIKADDIGINRSSKGYNVEIDYEPRIQLVGNLYFVVVFDKTVEVPSNASAGQ
ncbi:MAG: DUF4845 domain-containing protein [Gammaproteobacteria bacterium]|nr:DUF4845 domain-containing protein [Gammaproteobacteria bacterium]